MMTYATSLSMLIELIHASLYREKTSAKWQGTRLLPGLTRNLGTVGGLLAVK